MSRTRDFRRSKDYLEKKRERQLYNNIANSNMYCPLYKSSTREDFLKSVSKSTYKKTLKKIASSKARHLEDLPDYGGYKKSYDLKWNLY